MRAIRAVFDLGFTINTFTPYAWALCLVGFWLQRRWFQKRDPKRRKKTLALWLGIILCGETAVAVAAGWSRFTYQIMYQLLLWLIFGSVLAVLVYEVPAWLRERKAK